jgi:hypothetical protein
MPPVDRRTRRHALGRTQSGSASEPSGSVGGCLSPGDDDAPTAYTDDRAGEDHVSGRAAVVVVVCIVADDPAIDDILGRDAVALGVAFSRDGTQQPSAPRGPKLRVLFRGINLATPG